MKRDTRFDDWDRDMSSWLITWKDPDGIRHYLADDGDSDTVFVRFAKRFRYCDEAEQAAWARGPVWNPISVPEAMAT